MSNIQSSVVILNYNGKEYLRNCLRSVLAADVQDSEVIVVDNASTDGSARMVAEEFPLVRLIRSERNLGFAGGNNLGISESLGRYIILLNGDTIVSRGWLNHLVDTAAANKKVGIVGSKLLFPNGRINSTGLLFGCRLCNASDRGAGEIDYGQYDEKRNVLGVCFACTLVKRDVIRDVGLLDEKYFLYVEDLDYCLRTRLRGYEVVYCPDSIVQHIVGVSPRRLVVAQRHALKNRLRTLLKNYGAINVLRWGAYSLVFYLLLAPLSCIRKSHFHMAIVHLYALFWNLLNLPIRERLEIQRKRCVGDNALFSYSVRTRWS